MSECNHIPGPCSACGDGDTAQEFHKHDPIAQEISNGIPPESDNQRPRYWEAYNSYRKLAAGNETINGAFMAGWDAALSRKGML